MQPDEALYNDYIKHVRAYVANELIDGERPNERLMRPLEEAMGVDLEYMVDVFRGSLLAMIDMGFDWRGDRNMTYAIQQIVGGG